MRAGEVRVLEGGRDGGEEVPDRVCTVQKEGESGEPLRVKGGVGGGGGEAVAVVEEVKGGVGWHGEVCMCGWESEAWV